MNVILLEAILGRLLTAYGLVMLIPLGVAVYCKESAQWAFFITIGITVALGILMRLHGKIQGKMGVREGFAAVAGAWILASLFGALPYVLSGDISSYIDAVFETTSGLTTTGASVLTDLENFPRSILLWRSLTHWLGGMGIIVLFIVLLPNIGIGAVHLFNAEVPGPISEKVLPKIKDTALVLWAIYAGFTLLEVILLCLAGMTFYDAVNHAFATMATGGFSTRTASVAAFDSVTIELIIVFFMIIAGANFNIFILALRKRSLTAFKDTEFKNYIFIIILSFLAVTATLVFQQGTGALTAMRQSVFQVVSIMTTTGFATADFDQWPGLAKLILFFLMFVGGSAGSTAGGIKVARLILLLKMGWAQLKQVIHPRLVVNIVVQDKVIDYYLLSMVGRFFFLFILVFVCASLVLAGTGLEPFDAMSAAIATLGNVGPGFGVVGPMVNYASITPFGKVTLTFCMLLGRLELLTLLVLLQPEFWKSKKSW